MSKELACISLACSPDQSTSYGGHRHGLWKKSRDSLTIEPKKTTIQMSSNESISGHVSPFELSPRKLTAIPNGCPGTYCTGNDYNFLFAPMNCFLSFDLVSSQRQRTSKQRLSEENNQNCQLTMCIGAWNGYYSGFCGLHVTSQQSWEELCANCHEENSHLGAEFNLSLLLFQLCAC